jgi:hypothetical protein
MRTTVVLNDELYRAARRRAAEDGKTLREIVEAALRGYLGSDLQADRPFQLKWQTEKGRLRPGVRLNDRDALFDLMEERN